MTSPLTKSVLIACMATVAATMVYRADIALDPALPNDMPGDARFMATGYDLDHNERKGSWVACHPGVGGGESFCRVTDAKGAVIFQGAYLPVRNLHPVAAEGQRLAAGTVRWIHGPAEGAPVPVIPMTDGSLLVPRDDRDAMLDRWNRFPQEWQELTAK